MKHLHTFDGFLNEKKEAKIKEAGLDYEEVIPSQMTSTRQILGGPGILFSLKQ